MCPCWGCLAFPSLWVLGFEGLVGLSIDPSEPVFTFSRGSEDSPDYIDCSWELSVKGTVTYHVGVTLMVKSCGQP